jgi:hypothetical protein
MKTRRKDLDGLAVLILLIIALVAYGAIMAQVWRDDAPYKCRQVHSISVCVNLLR